MGINQWAAILITAPSRRQLWQNEGRNAEASRTGRCG